MKKGFTLVELLVVIAIISILAAVVVFLINPLELTKRERDNDRVTDMSRLQQALDTSMQEATGSGLVSVLCKDTEKYPCHGSSNSGARDINGTGWVKVDLSSQKKVPFATLPTDPINSSSNHYTYCANNDGWEIDTVLESDNHKGKMSDDGGDDPNLYEVGSNLQLISKSGGSCTY